MNADSISYWQRTAPVLPLSSDLPRAIDVAVIGGGLIGTATSYWLAREGISVALLEREAIGWGATGRNGGFVVAGSAESYTDTIRHLGHETAKAVMVDTLANQQLLRQVLEEEAIVCQYREPGNLHLALTEAQEEQLRAEVMALQADGFAATFLDHEAIQALIKTDLSSEVRGGRFKPGQGLVHSARLVRGLAQAAIRRGVRAYQADVRQLVTEGEHLCLHTARGSISTTVVVVAVNVWTGKLLPAFAPFLAPRREQMVAYAPLPPLFAPSVAVDLVAGEYFQQASDGAILIGGCNTVAPNADWNVWSMAPLPEVQAAIETILPRIFPALGPLQVRQRWAGLLDYTSDSHPLVDRLPTMPRVLVACGFSGHGMPFGLRFGQLLTEAVVRGVLPLALQPYRFDRPTLRAWRQAKE